MQTQVNSENTQRFYFEIPNHKTDVIEAIKGLLRAFNIDNKLSYHSVQNKKTNLHSSTNIKQLREIFGTLNLEKTLTKEDIAQERMEQYDK